MSTSEVARPRGEDYASVRARLGMPVTPTPRVRRDLVTRPVKAIVEIEAYWGAPLNLYAAPSPKLIIKLVALKHGTRVEEMIGREKTKALVRARDEALGLVYTHCRALSLNQLGDLFGGRDHTTIMHALRKMRMRGENFYRRVAHDRYHKREVVYA